MADSATLPPAAARLKRYQTFGEIGPMYEVLGPGQTPDTVAIRVFDTGEELDYRIDRALEDPEAL